MFELFGIYALLLGGWGLLHHRRAAIRAEATVEAAPVASPSERGTAARRHLSTLS
jgi:hypothetical protein